MKTAAGKSNVPVLERRSRFARGLERRVLHFIRRTGLTSPGQGVLTGVSGGPDSTALLLVLARLRETLGVELAAAHFDHGLRSAAEARQDAAYVAALARALGLRAAFGQGDTREHAHRRGLSLEEAARELRYAFLAQEAARLDASAVAVGHTASDQAETVLFHIVRGSGLDGLRGMRPRSPWPFGPGPILIRPLLEVWRQGTERYCQELGLTPRQDPTNLLLTATRNRLRHQVLPLLQELNPAVDESLLRLAAAAARHTDFLEQEAEALWPTLAQEEGPTVTLSREKLAELPAALVAHLLRRAAGRLSPAEQLEAIHIEAMLEGLAKSRARLHMPGGLRFHVRGPDLILTLAEEGLRPARPIPPTPLAIPGRTSIPGWRVEAEVIAPDGTARPASPTEAYLDAQAVGAPLLVRSRKPGDRLRPLGLGGEKKVQDILVDAKVPAEGRDAVPIVAAPWGVAWVVGHRLDERAAVTASTRSVLHLRFEPTPEEI